jgi:hypothetical protein
MGTYLHPAHIRILIHAPPYSEAAHRTIIALRSATSHHPFNTVADKYYKMEVELLRPGTKIPFPKTVSLDINTLYLELSKDVWAYFKVCISIKPSEIMLCVYLTIQKWNRAVHLAIDGWTSPLRLSYLGVIVIWYDCGKIH